MAFESSLLKLLPLATDGAPRSSVKYWSVQLIDATDDSLIPLAGKQYIIFAGGRYVTGSLNDKGRSEKFAIQEAMPDVYFDLKILPALGSVTADFCLKSAEEAKKAIWSTAKPYITNTCAIKVSHTLNNAVDRPYTIPRLLLDPARYIKQFTMPSIEKDLEFSHAIPRGVGAAEAGTPPLRYLVRVRNLAPYFSSMYPDAPHMVLSTAAWEEMSHTRQYNGVFCLTGCGWTDATGHFDYLENTDEPHIQGYLQRCTSMEVWKFSQVVLNNVVVENDVAVLTFHHVVCMA